ncbi:secretin [Vibrio cholerae]|nr:secretin [Vibrio cholerae]
MKIKLLGLILFFCATVTHASILIKQDDIDLRAALSAIAKDMQVKLVNDLDDQTQRHTLTQTLSGEGSVLLKQLSEIYDFDWYVYGGMLTVEAGKTYVNYAYKPRNISSQALLKELKQTFNTNATTKLKLTERGNSILLSGTRRFVNDAVSYANMVDKNQFLEKGNNLELARIEFHFISVIDRSVSSFDSTVIFPGAQTLIATAITNMGQFQNVSDGEEIVQRAYKVKLSEAEKQQLDEEEKTSKVQAIPAANALLVRGTPEEIKLAKRIAALIDIKRQQLLFSLKVYDVAVDRNENFGIDSSWLNGTKGIYDIIVPPFTQTTDFMRNFQALSSNGIARSVYQTNLLVLENQKGHFGKKETATITLISERQVEVQKIEADNSLYVTGRLLPSGNVQAKVEYIEESLGDKDSESKKNEPPRVSSQSIGTEVYIKPNQTVILGGFDNTVTQLTTSNVPVLSSIPLLGELFKNTSQKKYKVRRYVSVSFEVID